MTENNNLRIVNKQLSYDKVSLINPTNSSYIHIAAEIDKKIHPIFHNNEFEKEKLIKQCENWCKELNQINGVIEISLFKATIIPPGMGEYVKKNLNKIHLAKFDFVILIEVSSENICSEITTLNLLFGKTISCMHFKLLTKQIMTNFI